MARKASVETVQADMSPPNYRSALQFLRTIRPKQDKVSSVNGEIAAIYAKAESCKVHKMASKIFLQLDKLQPSERMEVMRGINGLMDAAGYDKEGADLMDQAENKVVPLRMQANDPAPQDADDGGMLEGENLSLPQSAPTAESATVTLVEPSDDGGFAEASEAEVEKVKGQKPKRGSITKMTPPSAPYTGDNSDLAG